MVVTAMNIDDAISGCCRCLVSDGDDEDKTISVMLDNEESFLSFVDGLPHQVCKREARCTKGVAALHPTNLQDTVGYCRILWDTAGYCGILQLTAGYCGILQDTAAYCRILWDTVAYCGILPDFAQNIFVFFIFFSQESENTQPYRIPEAIK